MERLTETEQRTLIQRYLGRFGKELREERTERIVAVPQTANPLFLRVLLEELRVFGEYEKLDERIDHYLEAPSPVELYMKVLARLEADYNREECPDLVRDAFSLLWAARRGLTESELLELLEIPRAVWSPLFLAIQDAQEALVSRKGGLLNFFHDYMRQAAERNYLADPEAEKAAHLRLADYFEKQEISSRTAEFTLNLHKRRFYLYNV